MRKLLLLVLILCLHSMARGQTAYDYRYWFDNDDSNVVVGQSATGQWQMDVNTNGLTGGLHSFHLQIADEDGNYSSPVTRIFVKTRSSSDFTHGFYWFDNDETTKQESSQVSGAFFIDVPALSEGYHTFHLQIADEDGNYSSPVTRIFVKTRSSLDFTHGFYWFDNDETTKQESSQVIGAFFIDVSALSEGYHTINYQVEDKDGTLSNIVSKAFLKIPQTEGVEHLTCMFSVDGEFYHSVEVPSTGGIISQELDVAGISQGLHRLQVQVVTPSGAATGIYEAFFIRAITTAELGNLQCIYSIDGQEFHTERGQMSSGVFHCDLNVEELDDGLHRIAYLLSDGKGTQTKLQTQFFVKTPIGGEGLARYEYWVNENSDERHIVDIVPHVDLFRLVSLLPIESQPVRSKLFHLAIEDEQPVLYAKNDIHIRFLDTSERFTEVSEQYVDYQQKQIVDDIIPLSRNTPVTIDVPAENQIRWFSLEASPGDTLAFKTSQATSLQVFSPKGEEVYSASGSTSVAYGGCHTWSKGTYYVALHDVTGAKPSITLDFFRLDKYDVVDWDVHTVGNGGCSTITFKGNGFRDLYAVDLYNAQGDSIKSVAVAFIDDANVSVLFNFTDVPLGNYDAVFHFTTEDKSYNCVVSVEEAKDIELALDVRYPSSFLRGTSTTYTITVTNKGNSTAYDVPMEIYLQSNSSFSDIESVVFKDEFGNEFNNHALNDIDKDSIDQETIEYLESVLAEFRGIQSFIVVKDSIETTEYGFTDQLITIAPKSSSTFYVEIKSSSSVTLNVRIPSEWITIHSERGTAHARSNAKASESNLCCEKEKWECSVRMTADVIGTITAFSGNPIISSLGCVTDVIDIGLFTAFEVACADGQTIGDKMKSFGENVEKRNSAISKTFNTILSCVTFGIGRIITKRNDELKIAKKNFDSAWNSMNNYKNQARDYYSKRDIALQKAAKADEAHDWTSYSNYLREADNAENAAKMYEEWAESAYKKAMEFNEQVVNLRQKIDSSKKLLADVINAIKGGLSSAFGIPECAQKWRHAEKNCPPNPNNGGGSSSPVPPSDPNDIYGYLSDAGSKYIADHVEKVNYTIEFENDTTFAEASAHTIVIKDTLDSRYFDLQSFLPTNIKLGSRETYLNEADVMKQNDITSFLKTIDMRPEINVIAQVEGTYSQNTGIAEWRFTSLDPMTMEPTDDLMQGILPVNYDGTSGIGEVMFEIGVKPNKADGTEIPNRAGIVFDYEETILTPTWTNIVDATAPESHIIDVQMATDTTATVRIEATDELSGPWRYDVYVQYGNGAAWWKAAEGMPVDSVATVKVYEGISHGFYVVATDSAGNVEQKEAVREYTLDLFGPQNDTNTKLELAQGWNWISQNQNEALSVEALKPYALRIVGQTEETIKDANFGYVGNLDELLPTQMYKVQMAGATDVQLGGKLFYAAFKPVPLYRGWNWIGYPMAHTMAPGEALASAESEEGELLIGQDGMAVYSDGQWTGTLTEMVPGQGFMYRSASDKNLFYNAMAQASSRRSKAQYSSYNLQSTIPDDWTVDKHRYPNVMGLIAQLWIDESLADAGDWILGAFCADECRGIAMAVDGNGTSEAVLMMNVYGSGGEPITFCVVNRETGEVLQAIEQEPFRADVVGTMSQPYALHIGTVTGVQTAAADARHAAVYDLQGRRVDGVQAGKGIYVVSGGKRSRAQKIVKK